ncbi:MAG TPA: lantibiotic dehydratase, partial [Micromonosporaceae bacterium]|nr:lantibiotic dehydratase [Micromonosporaceae bacterium]
YVDVYRTATGPLSGAGALAVEESIRQMMRIYGAMRMRPPGQPEPGHGGPRFMSRLTEEPRPVLEVLAERLTEVVAARKAEAAGKAAEKADDATAAPAPKRAEHPSTGWRPPVEGTPYHALVRWIDAEAASGPGGAPVRITSDVLDAVGAPEHDLAWPLDCTVRPFGSGHEAVLDMTMPGGILDARFNEALEGLHGTLDHVEAYRAFLAELDERTGVTSVELMIPPLRDVAANAVRRPAYATAWTGDADLSGYCEPDPRRPMRFLPLTELTVRRHGDKVVVEHLGQRVRILYHSMRVAPWPWSLLSSMLTYDNEQQDSNVPRLRCPLVALPDRDFLPRLLIGDAVVLSPAQWRVKSGRFWDPAADGELDKARRLVRLRAELGLPRFVAVYSRGHYGKPYPCDLDSLAAVETVERALGPAGAAADPDLDVYVEEMLPAPDEMPTRDLAHLADDRVAAEVMLRLPMHATPGDLAARAAGSRSAELVAVP